MLGWHVDGRGWRHHLHSAGQALVVLPVFASGGNVPGCGSTAVVSGSHIAVAQMLVGAAPFGLHYYMLFFVAHALAGLGRLPRCTRLVLGWFCSCSWLSELHTEEVGACEAGDVLLLHPFLAHASSENEQGSELRIAQNVCIRWSSDLDLSHFRALAGTGVAPEEAAAVAGRAAPSEVELPIANAILQPRLLWLPSVGSLASYAYRALYKSRGWCLE